MNEQITELAEQAAEFAFVSKCDTELQVDVEGKLYHIPAKFIEVFAKLVAKECAEVAGCNGHVSGFALGDLIKQHFGVE